MDQREDKRKEGGRIGGWMAGWMEKWMDIWVHRFMGKVHSEQLWSGPPQTTFEVNLPILKLRETQRPEFE